MIERSKDNLYLLKPAYGKDNQKAYLCFEVKSIEQCKRLNGEKGSYTGDFQFSTLKFSFILNLNEKENLKIISKNKSKKFEFFELDNTLGFRLILDTGYIIHDAFGKEVEQLQVLENELYTCIISCYGRFPEKPTKKQEKEDLQKTQKKKETVPSKKSVKNKNTKKKKSNKCKKSMVHGRNSVRTTCVSYSSGWSVSHPYSGGGFSPR